MKVIQNNNPSKYKVTLVGCVHGNERFGKVVFEYFEKELDRFPGLTIILANEEAMALRKRCVDTDLNRSFPGNPLGNNEERLAHELLGVIYPASFVLDIHSTRSDMKMVPIVTNLSGRTRKIMNHLPETDVVYMKGGFGSLISQFRGAVSLEYNNTYSRDPRNIPRLEAVILALLTGSRQSTKTHRVFECLGKIPLDVPVYAVAKNFEVMESTNIIPFLPRRVPFRGSKGFYLSKPKAFKC